jgi:hypothetical protein
MKPKCRPIINFLEFTTKEPIQILSIFNVHNELINEFTLGSSREVIPASPSVVPPILLGILRVSSVLVGVTLLLFLTRTRGKK